MRASLQEGTWLSIRSTLFAWAMPVQRRVAALTPVLPLIALILAMSVPPADAADYAVSGPPTGSAAKILRYSGALSAGGPLVIDTTSNGRRITRARGALELDCGDGLMIDESDAWRNVRVSKRGSFKAVYRDSFTDEGATVDVYDEFAGRFNRKHTKVSGTWRLQIVIHEPDGTEVDCDSGALRFTATR